MSKLLATIIVGLAIFYCEIQSLTMTKNKLWNYEITNIKFVTSDKNLIDGDLYMKRISRGNFAVSGFLDLKIDIDESSLIDFTSMRDSFCMNEYKKLPYSYLNTSVEIFLNKQYKPIAMDTAKNCTIDSPIFETFVPPLTKRNITINECQLSKDNLPTVVEEGCYKLKFLLHGQAEAYVEIDFFIEKNI